MANGETTVTVWDEGLTPQTYLASFSAVDVDAFALSFLSSLDLLLAPALAAQIERINPDAFDRLRGSREAVVRVLVRNLSAVLADQPSGDLETAAATLTEVLSASLADAYAVAAIVQLPAIEPGPSWQTFTVTAERPAERRVVVVTPIAETSVAVPVALRASPPFPALSLHGAPGHDANAASDDPIADAVRAALSWSLGVSLETPRRAAQDDAWVSVAFNRPVRRADAAVPGSLGPLAAGLARFETGFASLVPLLGLIESGDPKAVELATILAYLVRGAAMILELGPEPPIPAAVDPVNGDQTWVLRQADLALNVLTVFGRAAGSDAGPPLRFPTADGLSPAGAPRAAPASRSPDGQAGWMEADYVFPAAIPDRLTLALCGLNVRIEQTVVGAVATTRNVELNGPANPVFVCRAPSFSAEIAAPAIQVESLGPFDGNSVAQMLVSTPTPLVAAAGTLYPSSILSLAVAYRYPAASPPESRDPPFIEVPVIRIDDQALEPDPAPFAEACAEAVATWGRAVPLPRDGARLSLSLTLDAVIDLPDAGPRTDRVVTIDRLDLNLPAGWPGN